MMRSVPKSIGTSWPAASQRTKGAAFNTSPMAKISAVRVATLRQNADDPCSRRRGSTSASALPTANRKNGNTRSVGVQPCHAACASGG